MVTILVVDDSAVDRTLVGGLLQQETDWTVTACEDGLAATRLLATEEPPDLIVTDLQMPEMDGLQLVRAIKEEWPFIPVILLTARGSEEIAVEALRGGAASYVPKRRVGIDLVETIRRILSAVEADRGGGRLQHYLRASEQTFRLRNDPEHIRLLTLHVQQQLRCLPLGDEIERMRVSLAFEEALKNACLHGNLELANPSALDREGLRQAIQERSSSEPYSARHIHVEVRVNREAATFLVRDEGRGFDHQRLIASAVLDDQEEASTRGLALLRTTFDEVTFNAAGNEVTLLKRGIHHQPLFDDDEGEDT